MNTRCRKILLVDDDPDDRMLVKEAMVESRLQAELDTVEDGEQMMDYLRRRGPYAALANTALPGLILLDLNMPRKDGREALRDVKADPELCSIPVVVLTTSTAEEDIARAYRLGGNSFIIKPAVFQTLVQLVGNLASYWFETVQLPGEKERLT